MQKLILKIQKLTRSTLRSLYIYPFKISILRKSRNAIHQYWKRPSENNLPETYLSGRERSQFLLKLIKKYIKPDAKILEIGCNVGRNLNYLFNAGYKNLVGVEINANAIALMKQIYPEMKRQIQVYNKPIEEIITNFEDNSIDVVFTMAVLEHIHPNSEFIFSEMARLTKSYLIVIEDEKGASWRHFPRNYKKIFESRKMKQIFQLNCKGIDGLGLDFWARVFIKVNK